MNRLIYMLERLFMGVSVLCMVSIMITVSIDAIGRYAFNAPLQWSYELVTFYLMVIAIYFAASSTFQQGDHIGVDLFYHLMGKRVRALVETVVTLLGAVIFAFIAYGAWKSVLKVHAQQDFIPGYIMWPTWLSYLPVPLGTALLVLRMLHHCWTLLSRGEDPNVVDHLDGVTTEGGE